MLSSLLPFLSCHIDLICFSLAIGSKTKAQVPFMELSLQFPLLASRGLGRMEDTWQWGRRLRGGHEQSLEYLHRSYQSADRDIREEPASQEAAHRMALLLTPGTFLIQSHIRPDATLGQESQLPFFYNPLQLLPADEISWKTARA